MNDTGKGTPGWLLGLFTLTIIGGLLYAVVADGIMGSKTQSEMLHENSSSGKFVKAVIETRPERTADAISTGESQFKAVCAACHGADMKGLVGPDLTDSKWFHGSSESAISEEEIVDVVMKGRNGPPDPANKRGAMPAHAHLGKQTVWSITYYLSTKNKSIQRVE